MHHVDDPPLRAAEVRLAQRQRALKIAREDPTCAFEVGVGRPNVRGALHREVIDINKARAGAIAGLPGVSHRLGLRVTRIRDR